MMIKVNRARDLSIKNATKKFYKEIKIACKEGKFCTTFYCTSRNEILLYKSLARGNEYYYVVSPRDNWIDVSW